MTEQALKLYSMHIENVPFYTSELKKIGSQQLIRMRDNADRTSESSRTTGLLMGTIAILTALNAAPGEFQHGLVNNTALGITSAIALVNLAQARGSKNRAKQFDQSLVMITNDPSQAKFDDTVPQLKKDGYLTVNMPISPTHCPA